MKQIGTMTEAERTAYFSDVEKWREEDYPRLESVVDAWTDAEYKVFDEGLRLCSAMARAKQFVGVAYRLSIDRRMREIRGFMDLILSQAGVRRNTSYPRPGHPVAPAKPVVARVPKPSDDEDAVPVQSVKSPKEQDAQRRPNHYDEWADRMSAALRDKVASLSDLYATMAHYRQMVEHLASDPRHSEQDMSRAARLAVGYEKRILAIHRQAEIEWAELTGKQVAPDVKREAVEAEQTAAHATDRLEREPSATQEAKQSAEVQKQPAAQGAQAVAQPHDPYDDEQYSKSTYREILAIEGITDEYRKFLIYRRRSNLSRNLRLKPKDKEGRADVMRGYIRELIDMGEFNASRKIRESCAEVGIDLEKEFGKSGPRKE